MWREQSNNCIPIRFGDDALRLRIQCELEVSSARPVNLGDAMSQSLARVWLHVVFSTKDRRPFLRDEQLRQEMFKMLSHFAGELACPTAAVGGWEDHVHILCGLARTVTIADFVQGLKGETSRWAKERAAVWRGFFWQGGYGAFSVSQSLVDQVVKYIADQAEHHRRLSFQDEFRAICQRHGVDLDERFAWE